MNSRIAEVEQAFKNIPQMLYFSPSSVAYDGIGVYAAESLPKGIYMHVHACVDQEGGEGGGVSSLHVAISHTCSMRP